MRGSRWARIGVATAAIFALGLFAPAVASAATSASASVGSDSGYSLKAGGQGYFAVNGGIIWSKPGSGIRKGLGYRGQGFCVDGASGSYYHGRNQATGVTGWTHRNNLNYNPAIDC